MNCQKSIKYLEQIADILPTPTYWMDCNQKYLGANQQMVSSAGAESFEKDFFGKTPLDVFPRDTAEKIITHHQSVIKKQIKLTVEEHVIDIKTNETKCFETVISPLYDDANALIGTICIFIDITAKSQKAEEEKKKKIFEHLEKIAPSIPANVYWLDKDNVIIGVNENTLKAIGLTSYDEIVGKTVYELYPKDIADVIVKHHTETITLNKTLEHEEFINDVQTGQAKYFLTIKSPLYDDNSNIIGTVGISIDITAKKEAEQLKLENMEQKIKQAKIEEKVAHTKMAAGSIAHDLRTPLLALKSLALGIENLVPSLLDGYEKAKAASLDVIPIRKQRLLMLNEVIKAGVSEVDFANHYIDLVLGNLKYDDINTSDFEPLLMSDILNESLESYPYLEDQKSLVHLDVQHDFTIMGDRVYFKNLINNLLRNSFGFIKAENKGEIYITCLEHELHVKDTAKGASPEICKTIFEPYKSNRRGGTGLGLAFCKNIIESFGGTTSVESIEGEFIDFIFSFKPVGSFKFES